MTGRYERDRQPLELRVADRHGRRVDESPPARPCELGRGEIGPGPRHRPRHVEDQATDDGQRPETRHPAGDADTSPDDQRRHAEHDHDDGEDDGDGRSHGDGQGRHDHQQRRTTHALSPAERDHAFHEVDLGGRRVGGADADGHAQEVDEPRHRGVGDETRQVPC